MKRILLLLIVIVLPIQTTKKRRPIAKSSSNTTVQPSIATSKLCPYCNTIQDHLGVHMLSEHNIRPEVISECLVAITAFNAVKNSRYTFASYPCECGMFFRSQKILLNHQKSPQCCPMLHINVHLIDSAQIIKVKIEPPPASPVNHKRLSMPSNVNPKRVKEDDSVFVDNILTQIPDEYN